MEEIDYEALPTNSVPVTLAAGAFAGIVEHTAMYPIDSIKTRLQVISPSPSAVYSGVINAFHRISSAEGAVALWRGVTSVIIGAGPAHAIYFCTYEQAKKALLNFGGRNNLTVSSNDTQSNIRVDNTYSHLAHAAAGALATIANDGLMTPFDVVKQQMQVHNSQFKSVISCAKHIFHTEGIRGFYVSYPTTLMMSVPFQAIHFAMYEYFQDIFNPKNVYDPLSHCISGGAAGAVSAFLTTPLDVTKTLLQTRTVSNDPSIRNASGLVDAFKLIYKKDGFSGYMRGANARVLANMPSTAICWTTYEFMKMFLNRNF